MQGPVSESINPHLEAGLVGRRGSTILDGAPTVQVRTADRRALIRRRDSQFRRALAVADILALATALFLSASVYGDDQLRLGALAALPLLVLIVKAMGLYDRDVHLLHKTTLDEVPGLFGIATLTTLLIWLSDGLVIEGHLGRRQILGTWILLFVLMICGRALARFLVQRLGPGERCLLVGDLETAEDLREKLALSHSLKAELVGVVLANGASNGAKSTDPLEGLAPLIGSKGIDRVIVAPGAGDPDSQLDLIREVKSYGVKVSVLPDASRVAGASFELDHLHGITLLGMRRFEITRSSRMVKRAFDVTGSALALLVLSPILATVAIAIKLDTPGPVLFRQRRVGRNGRHFEMFKFRSMVDGADERKEEVRHLNEGAQGLFKITEDPRLTRSGRLIRRLNMDELPQLINVLRGEMSLVGPRPLIPEEDERISGAFRRRLDLAPGITGPWQVLGSSSRIPLEEMVKLDYLYFANWSLWNDVRLILRTVPLVVGGRGI